MKQNQSQTIQPFSVALTHITNIFEHDNKNKPVLLYTH